MHWFFSALAGNYGNRNILNPFDTVVRKQILSEFLQTYSRILKTDGYLVIELGESIMKLGSQYQYHSKTRAIFSLNTLLSGLFCLYVLFGLIAD
ncbi:hypothetical protein CEP14_08425 [Cylindrospermopsis raciborskii C04]|uniref:Uncharacterized protein n=1 Tax=Cylindrospermopsis raciborskii C07 TaxID=2014886 RepID=A0ABX4WKH8_9CYAN|nr:hypothetical protein CEP13_09815 [Cylindrospermopsis raciborskii C03]PNJ96002.1 hypothetical protein CEP15_11070 [Cylindrospermopsis raciborskii C07]PNJ96054.1 hypothetical protein CEP14_08425 [Cylindrospermopsis raciborskii C04]